MMPTRLIGLVIAAIFSGVATSCGLFSLDVSSQRLRTAPVLSPVDPHSVALLRNPPTTHYTVIGTIRVSWFGIRTDEDILHDVEIQNALRDEAARLGADAVISIVLVPRRGQRPDDFPLHEAFADHLVATAIRTDT